MTFFRRLSRGAAALAILAYAAGIAWPCSPAGPAGGLLVPPVAVAVFAPAHPHPGSGEERRSAGAHEGHGVRGAASHEQHGAHGSRDVGSTPILVARCMCGCDERPAAAGISTAPGHALLPYVPAYDALVQTLRLFAAEPAAFPAPAFAIDHIPEPLPA